MPTQKNRLRQNRLYCIIVIKRISMNLEHKIEKGYDLEKQIPLEAVIFDLGGVVFAISVERILIGWTKSAGCNPIDIAPKFKVDDYYRLFEIGKITPQEYREHVSNVLGINISPEDFDRGWNDIYLELLPGIESLLEQLKRKVRIVVLTNTNEIHALDWRTRYQGILGHFEKIFTSHEIGARKPTAEAFQIVLDYLNLPPEKVAFFDDTPENVDGANSLGIKAFVANSPKEVAEELRKMEIEIELD